MTKATERTASPKSMTTAKEAVWKELRIIRDVASGRFEVRKESGGTSVTIRSDKKTDRTITKK